MQHFKDFLQNCYYIRSTLSDHKALTVLFPGITTNDLRAQATWGPNIFSSVDIPTTSSNCEMTRLARQQSLLTAKLVRILITVCEANGKEAWAFTRGRARF